MHPAADPTPWAAIVGTGHAGRVELAAQVVTHLRAAGLTVAGALQEQTRDATGPTGWDAVNLETDERIVIARRSTTPELCEWSFEQAAFDALRLALSTSTAQVVLLELGELESRRRGNWDAFAAARSGAAHRVVVACIRPQVLANIALDLPDPIAGLELPPEGGGLQDGELEEFVEAIVSAVPAMSAMSAATDPFVGG